MSSSLHETEQTSDNTVLPPQSQVPPNDDLTEVAETAAAAQDIEPPSAWAAEAREQPKIPRRVRRALYYCALGLVSFLFFLYITFPYAVLKEFIVTSISSQLSAVGMNAQVNIGSLRPSWVTGIVIENLEIMSTTDARARTKFEEVRARLKLLPFLIGNVGVTAYVQQQKGSIDIDASLPISALLGSGAAAPVNHATIEFNEFTVDSIVNHGLAIAGGAQAMNPNWVAFLGPLLTGTSAGGRLSGTIEVDRAKGDTETVQGNASLKFKDLFLRLDEGLQIAEQKFKKAEFNLSFDQTGMTLKTPTILESQEVKIDTDGRVDWKNPPTHLDLKLRFKSHGPFYEKIGSLLLTFLHCPSPATETAADGGKQYSLDVRITGPVGNQKCQ